jgi:hypothetical protein
MALVLAMFAGLLARGEEPVPSAIEPPSELATSMKTPAPAPSQPLDMRRYEKGAHMATTGVVLVPVGLGIGAMGLARSMSAENPDQGMAGVGMILIGSSAVLAGPPLAYAGSMKSARALRAAGVDVPTGWAVASIALYAGSMIMPGAYLGSYVAVLGQMSTNRSALRRSGLAPAKGSATVVPWTDDDVRGMALVGSF